MGFNRVSLIESMINDADLDKFAVEATHTALQRETKLYLLAERRVRYITIHDERQGIR